MCIHQFLAESRETEHFMTSFLTGLYDELAVKIICKFLNFFTSLLAHERNEI